MEQKNLDLEEQSFNNMVFYYYPELQQVISGVSVVKVFPARHTRRVLRKRELLETYYSLPPGLKRGVVSDKACSVLGEWTKMFEGK